MEEMPRRPSRDQGDLFGADLPREEEPCPAPRHARGFGPEGKIRIGTSGYSFVDWVGTFYPEGTARNRMLDEYVKHFDVVEINSSHYRIPTADMFARMEAKTPPGFEFMVKLFQGMTHKAEDDPAMYADFAASVMPLKEAGKFAGYLAQFPWQFKKTTAAEDRLAALRDRHDSWVEAPTFEFLREHGIGYCSVDEPHLQGLVPPVAVATTDVGYVRLHGRNARDWWGKSGADRYNYDYKPDELLEWTQKMHKLEEKVKKVYAFFNNCHAGHAARNAELMMELLGGELGTR
jgi:uncharacterized protein YecE (DUF72 family)